MSTSDKKNLGEDFLKKVEKRKKETKELEISVKKNLDSLNAEKDEMQKMMQDLDSMVEQIEAIRKDIQEKTGLTIDDMKNYVDNPNNFSEIEWKKLQKRKADIEQNFQQMTKKSMDRSNFASKGSKASQSKATKSSGEKKSNPNESKEVKKPSKSRRDKWLRLP